MIPLPHKVTDLVGRQVYWSEDGEPEVPATVVGARWSGTAIRLPDGTERAGIQFLMDRGDGSMKWSMTYPEPNPDPDDDAD